MPLSAEDQKLFGWASEKMIKRYDTVVQQDVDDEITELFNNARENGKTPSAAVSPMPSEARILKRSKNFIAQKNELLCKVIAHNIIVLIHEMFELNIKPDFNGAISTVG